jgi:8-oxo-dGTP pyrophosphatase MutT (NUDIX family)
MQRMVTLADVERAWRAPLPGQEAQSRMSTRPRGPVSVSQAVHPPRQGAVLILLYPCEGQLCLPLTRRTERVAHHKGQISLPGGARDPQDDSFWETALRETLEEIGIAPQHVRRIGALSPLYIPNSNFDIHPFVGYIATPPAFVADAIEVAEIITLPLQTLLDPATKAEETWTLHGHEACVPFYRYQQHVIWGATAMVLSEFEVLLAAALDGHG